MKKLKLIEIVDEPSLGDYVVCSYSDNDMNNFYNNNKSEQQEFIQNKIGRIVKDNWNIKYKYAVTYDDIPDGVWISKINDVKVIVFDDSEIEYFSFDIDNAERYINTKKFNL